MWPSSPRTAAIVCIVLAAGAAVPMPASGEGGPQAGLFDTTTQTSMPHLDEALRYAVTYGRRCLDRQDLSRAFPILNDVSLQDCRLVLREQRPESASYLLQCVGGRGTTGEANWQFDERDMAGTLSVKLGGKNMTFSQRVVGRWVGGC